MYVQGEVWFVALWMNALNLIKDLHLLLRGGDLVLLLPAGYQLRPDLTPRR
jgi:hypothetical protein